MKELSVFIDESGDFGEYAPRSPYYIISMILHDQAICIDENIIKLDHELAEMGLPDHCVHAGPIIRQEQDYQWMDVKKRQKILKKMMAFFRSINVSCKSVYIEKRQLNDPVAATGQLAKEIGIFIRDNLEYFLSFDTVKIYYDNGQVEINKILSSVFNVMLENVEFRKVYPSEYRLFQVADLVCTLSLIELKHQKKQLSRSEMMFFNDERTLKKNYLKPFNQKKM